MRIRSIIVGLAILGGAILIMALPWLLTTPNIGRADPEATLTPTQTVIGPETPTSPFAVAASDVRCSAEITTTDTEPTGNYTFTTAAPLANYLSQSLLNWEGAAPKRDDAFYPVRPDFYRLDNARVNYRYTVEAEPTRTNNYTLGIIVYEEVDGEYRQVTANVDTSTYKARITFEAQHVGPYFFKVYQISSQCSGSTYELYFKTPVAPTATPVGPTSTPQPTVPPAPGPSGFDQYEPNYDFDSATTIAPGQTYNLNFIPWANWSVDNDFFRIRIKPKLRLTCETSELDPGVDPNMIFFTGPSWDNSLMSNDDIALGNFNSRLSYYSTYEGYMYILVGQGNRMDPRDTENSAYKLRCTLEAPGTSTPTTPPPDKDPAPTARPTATPPSSPVATPTPPPTPTEAPTTTNLTFRLLTTPEPTTPTPTPTGFRTFRVVLYYDEDQNKELGAGEGVPGFYVRALSSKSGEQLAQGYTDEQGQLSFTVPTVDTVRVRIPLLGLDRMVNPDTPEVIVRIAPQSLPKTIP